MSTALPVDTNPMNTTMNTAVILSLLFHGLIVVIGLMGLPYVKKPILPPEPISVEIVEIDEITQTNKRAAAFKEIEKPIEKPIELKEDKPPAPPKVDLQAPPQMIEPKPQDIKEEVKPKPKPTPPPPKEAELKDPEPEPKEEEVVEETPAQQEMFDNLMKNLQESEPQPAQQEVSEIVSNDRAPLGEFISSHELQALSNGFRRCFKIPIGAEGMHEMVADIRIWLDFNGNVTKAEFDSPFRVQADRQYRTLAEAARRAALDPNCSPVDIPLEKRHIWKDQYIIVPFDPRRML
ncbi:MAG: hypothetical protein AAF569_04405 [Pseudomonadota bacterium]